MAKVREFSSPIELLGREGAQFFGRVLAMISDVALVVDPSTGQILDMASGSEDLTGYFHETASIDTQPSIYELVTTESQAKIRDLLVGKAPSRWRQVNFGVSGGPDIPVSFRSLSLQDNRVLLAGREDTHLAKTQRRFAEAQRKLETTFARLRDSDKRYRSLLNLLDLAVLTLEGPLNRVEEVSDEAAEILDVDARKLRGKPFLDQIDPADHDELATVFEKIRGGGGEVETRVTLLDGSRQLLRVAPFQSGPGWRILVHIGRSDVDTSALRPDHFAFNLISSLPYGAVITDDNLNVRAANAALASLVGLGAPSALIGHSLDDILGTRGLDTAIMAAELRDHYAFHNFSSALASDTGAAIEVDVDGARTVFGGADVYCFLIRPRYVSVGSGSESETATLTDSEVRDRVGRLPLKAIVRQTTDVIEKAAIERALELTGNNRAAAAEMLGVSRQNLYGKIERFGIGEEDTERPN